MKNNLNAVFFFLLILVVAALHLSCKPAGENNSEQSTSFVGKSWKLQDLSVEPYPSYELHI